MAEKSESWVQGYGLAKMTRGSIYPVEIEFDESVDREEFMRGWFFAKHGYELPRDRGDS